ncbi:MAG: methyltransferase domain-containing protein [Actinobacteria bacterium]|nr:methyltransferase domain-containing protein [Actinomycetota bacterium]
MGFFDFLQDNPRYAGRRLAINRLNKRHRFLVRPYRSEIAGARVLDLASHDGRWPYALSAAGAREVVGVEARPEMIDQFAAYPEGEVKDRVRLVEGDVYVELPRLIEAGETFDVVAVYGLLYHLTDHYGLLALIARLRPRLIVIDSEFALSADPVVRFAMESTESHLNTIAHVPGQGAAPIGVPSRSAMELMARSLGYETTWADWESLPERQRGGLASYYRQPPRWKRRDTCALRPVT